MNNDWTKRGSAVIAVLLLVGCGDSGASLYTAVTSTQAAAVGTLCECFAALEFASVAECEADYGDMRTVAQAACLEDVFDTYEAELRPSVNCELSAQSAAQSCVEQVNMCDRTGLDACLDARETATDACPEAPRAVLAALAACFN